MHWNAKKARVLMLLCFMAGSIALTYAYNGYLTSFNLEYDSRYQTGGSNLDSCLLCHPDPSIYKVKNSYANAYVGAGYNFVTIENLDSDGDGFTNGEEIAAFTLPGDDQSYPNLTSDTESPVITFYGIPEISDALTVPVSAFTATDNVGVTGYWLTETTGTPSTGANGWVFPAPSSYTFQTEGFHTLYAWARDEAGNISQRAQSSTTITLPDNTPPQVTSFSLPANSDSLTVPVSAFKATDNIGVTGYMLTDSPGVPSAGGAGWSASAPGSYTFTSASSHTLYAWAKDAAGNVSSPLTATVNINLPPAVDSTSPQITSFSLPANSDSLTVPVSAFTATDNVGVTGYILTDSPEAPSAGGAGWSASAPGSYTFTSASSHTLYAWAKDAAGNVSSPANATVNINLPPTVDSTSPQITSFSLSDTSNTLTVPITSFSAKDDVGVTEYLISTSPESSPLEAAGWTSSQPSRYTFASEGTQTLYAWVRDAAGNVSAMATATTRITTSIQGSNAGDMTLWESRWFELKIRQKENEDSLQDAYLNITRWDPQGSVLYATLYTRDSETNQWQSWDLPLHYTNGSRLRFFSWFEFAGEFNFSASILGKVDKGLLSRATFKATGLSHSDTVDDSYQNDANDDDSYEDRSDQSHSYIGRFHDKIAAVKESGRNDSSGMGSQRPKITGKIRELVTIEGYLIETGLLPADLLVY